MWLFKRVERERLRALASVIGSAGVLLAFAASASAEVSTVTIGSPLTATPHQGALLGTLTDTALPEAGALVASPVDGTIVRWRLLDASGGPFYLRVLTPNGGTTFTGAGTSGPLTPIGTGLQLITTTLPIHAGQYIGIDSTNSTDKIGFVNASGAHFENWDPRLADGQTSESTQSTANLEAEFNADVEPASAASCVVPKLKGKKLKADRKALNKADCALGKVKGHGGKQAKVTKQSPKPGTVLPAGSKVNISLR